MQNKTTLPAGVSQGFNLEPLLFNFYYKTSRFISFIKFELVHMKN